MKDIKFWINFGLVLFIMGCFISYRESTGLDHILAILLAVIGGSLFTVGHNWSEEDLEWKISKIEMTPNSVLVVKAKRELNDAELEHWNQWGKQVSEYYDISILLFAEDVDLTVVEKLQ